MSQQDDLFEAHVVDAASAQTGRAPVTAPPSDEGQAVVPTSRNNIIEWLSSRIVSPRAAFSKYYEDALSVAQNVVPVVRAPVAAELLDVEGAPHTNFPVMAEVDADAVVWASDDVGHLRPSPLEAVRRLHFADAEALEEFEARSYDNVPGLTPERVVTPSLFAGSGRIDRTRLREPLAAIHDEPALSFDLSDRLGGARLLALTAAARDGKLLRSVADIAFSGQARRRRKNDPTSWLAIDASLAHYKVPKAADLDERIFRAAAQIMLTTNRTDAWDAVARLDAVDEILTRDAGIRKADGERWAAAHKRTQSILRGEEAFSGFAISDFRMEKALLLVLVRPGPADVLEWGGEIGAQPLELVIAALLSGLVHGRKATSTELRPEPLDRALAARELIDLGGDKPKAEVTVETDADDVILRVDDAEILRAPAPPKSTAEIFASLDVAHEDVVRVLVDIALAKEWPSAIVSTVSFHGDAEIRPRRGGFDVAAIGVPTVVSDISRDEFARLLEQDHDPQLREALLALRRARAVGSDE